MRFVRPLSVVLGALLSIVFSLSCGFAQAPDRNALIQADKRLSQKITFEQRQARIGEVFNAVEKQTGIHLTVEDRDGAAGEIISVFVRDLTVADLMTSLWSLVGFQRGEWRWVVTETKSATPGSPAASASSVQYRLVRPITARDYAATVDAEIQKYFAALMEMNIRASRLSALSPADAANFPEANLSITDERIRLKQRAFAALCTPSERLQLLQGKIERLEFARSDWPAEARAYVENEVAISKANIESHPEWRALAPNLKVPNPQKIDLRADYIDSKLTPNIWFGADGVGGYPVVGSTATEKLWQDRVEALWLLPGDTRTDPASEVIKYSPAAEAEDQAVMRLKQLHERTGLPVLARLTGAEIQVPQDLKKIAMVGDITANLRERHVLLKWRNGTLLAMDAAWIRRAADLERGKTPWGLVREIREQITSDSGGAPSLASLCRMAGALNETQLNQLDKLQSLLPDVNPIEVVLGSFILQNQPLLAEMNRRPELQTTLISDQGVAVRSLSATVQEWAKPLLGGQVPVTARLRIRLNDYNDSPPTETNPAAPRFTNRREFYLLTSKGTSDLKRDFVTTSLFTWYGRPRGL